MYWFWQGDEAHSADDIDYDYVEGDIDNDGKRENLHMIMMKIWWKYENDNSDEDVHDNVGEAKIGSRARRLKGSRASLWQETST